MLLRTLSASLLGTLWTGKGTIRVREGSIRASEFLMPPHVLTNFEMQKY